MIAFHKVTQFMAQYIVYAIDRRFDEPWIDMDNTLRREASPLFFHGNKFQWRYIFNPIGVINNEA